MELELFDCELEDVVHDVPVPESKKSLPALGGICSGREGESPSFGEVRVIARDLPGISGLSNVHMELSRRGLKKRSIIVNGNHFEGRQGTTCVFRTAIVRKRPFDLHDKSRQK